MREGRHTQKINIKQLNNGVVAAFDHTRTRIYRTKRNKEKDETIRSIATVEFRGDNRIE